MSDFPDAHFGTSDNRPADWRKTEDSDPDDEEIKTPKDVVMMLGFDPADEDGSSSNSHGDDTMAETEADREDRARKDAQMLAKLDAIVGKLDGAHARLDAMDASDKARKDAAAHTARLDAARKDRFGARKDGESFRDWKSRHDADETAMCDAMRKDGAEELQASKAAADCRADAETAERKGGGESFDKWAKEEGNEREHKNDKARKDAEAAEAAEAAAKKEREEGARKDAALTAENAALTKRLAAMEARFIPVSSEDRNALALAQSRADGIAGLFGQRASQFTPGETPIEYRRRLAAGFKEHSPRFKDKRLDSLDAEVFGPIEEIIYADAATAARSPNRAGSAGILIKISEPDETGRTITRWTGDPMAWMQYFMTDGHTGKILRHPGAQA